MSRLHIGATLLLAALAWTTGPARAEHAFLCEGGRIVYANDATLEKVKREDACVAGYYGLKPEVRPGAAADAAGPPVAAVAGPRAAPTVQLRPSSAREVVRNPRHAARPRFHEARTDALPAGGPSASPAPLQVINAETGQ